MFMHHHSDRRTHLTAMVDRAAAHIDAGQLDTAASIYTQVLAMAPDNADLQNTLGLVYLEQGRTDQALFHIGRSIELNPMNSRTYRNMGDALGASGQFSLAISAYKKACVIDPANTDALLNLGHRYHDQDMYDHARKSLQQLIRMEPGNIRAMNNLGRVYHDMGQFKQALACYDHCLLLQPQYAEARFNRAVLLLAMGDFDQGWSEYEWRFKRAGADNVYPHRLSTRRWQGENFQGRRLLVHCEQGMGDVLQFARFLPMVKQRGGTLILEAHAPLVPLLQSLACIDEMIAFDVDRPPDVMHHMHIPLLSLPRLFGTTPDNIPTDTPYIEGCTQGHAAINTAFRPYRLNIGLVWASSALNPKRNCPLERCDAWFQRPGLHYVGLQKGEAAGALPTTKHGLSSTTSLGTRLNDFVDTAAVLSRLDLIISVDTAVAHLAGAMDKPLWVLLPYNADWRWPKQAKASPWYPKARIFRQPTAGDWDSVIADVNFTLDGL